MLILFISFYSLPTFNFVNSLFSNLSIDGCITEQIQRISLLFLNFENLTLFHKLYQNRIHFKFIYSVGQQCKVGKDIFYLIRIFEFLEIFFCPHLNLNFFLNFSIFLLNLVNIFIRVFYIVIDLSKLCHYHSFFYLQLSMFFPIL